MHGAANSGLVRATPRQLSGADVYGLGSGGLLVNHAAGDSIWQILLDVSVAGNFAIMLVGCPVCIVAEDMRDELPEDLRPEAVLVRTGTDILQLVTNA